MEPQSQQTEQSLQEQQLPPVPPVAQTTVDTAFQSEQVEQPSESQPAAQQAEPPVETPEPSFQRPVAQESPLEWQASEFIEREKSVWWFVGLAAIVVALIALDIFVLKVYTFAVLVVVMAVAIAIWAKRSAPQVYYRLDATGVTVNDKYFPFQDFRAFGVVQDGGIYAITLLPVKRFAPGVNIYFPQEFGERIVDTLGAVLPMQEVKPDLIDNLTRRLNF